MQYFIEDICLPVRNRKGNIFVLENDESGGWRIVDGVSLRSYDRAVYQVHVFKPVCFIFHGFIYSYIVIQGLINNFLIIRLSYSVGCFPDSEPFHPSTHPPKHFMLYPGRTPSALPARIGRCSGQIGAPTFPPSAPPFLCLLAFRANGFLLSD